MITLAEQSLPFFWRNDCRILKSFPALSIDGRLQDGPSAGLENAEQLRQSLTIVWHVFQNVNAQDHVESIRVKRDIGDVDLAHRPAWLNIGRDVVEIWKRRQRGAKRVFRREMKNSQGVNKKVPPVLKIQPQQAMPFKTTAPGTHRVRPLYHTER
jgi:hypothetical protein